jgi:hypothetical protein
VVQPRACRGIVALSHARRRRSTHTSATEMVGDP